MTIALKEALNLGGLIVPNPFICAPLSDNSTLIGICKSTTIGFNLATIKYPNKWTYVSPTPFAPITDHGTSNTITPNATGQVFCMSGLTDGTMLVICLDDSYNLRVISYEDVDEGTFDWMFKQSVASGSILPNNYSGFGVIIETSTGYYFFRYLDDTSANYQWIVETWFSADKSHFTKLGSIGLSCTNPNGISPKTIIYTSGVFYLFYTGADGKQLFRQTSTDGYTWGNELMCCNLEGISNYEYLISSCGQSISGVFYLTIRDHSTARHLMFSSLNQGATWVLECDNTCDGVLYGANKMFYIGSDVYVTGGQGVSSPYLAIYSIIPPLATTTGSSSANSLGDSTDPLPMPQRKVAGGLRMDWTSPTFTNANLTAGSGVPFVIGNAIDMSTLEFLSAYLSIPSSFQSGVNVALTVRVGSALNGTNVDTSYYYQDFTPLKPGDAVVGQEKNWYIESVGNLNVTPSSTGAASVAIRKNQKTAGKYVQIIGTPDAILTAQNIYLKWVGQYK